MYEMRNIVGGIFMTIDTNKNGTNAVVALAGRLDTTTAPELENSLKETLDGCTELVFDFAKVEYVSSAGLRVLLATQKVMNKQGSMIIKNVDSAIMEVFEITGFVDILTIG